jgi:hypothetical protein
MGSRHAAVAQAGKWISVGAKLWGRGATMRMQLALQVAGDSPGAFGSQASGPLRVPSPQKGMSRQPLRPAESGALQAFVRPLATVGE